MLHTCATLCLCILPTPGNSSTVFCPVRSLIPIPHRPLAISASLTWLPSTVSSCCANLWGHLIVRSQIKLLWTTHSEWQVYQPLSSQSPPWRWRFMVMGRIFHLYHFPVVQPELGNRNKRSHICGFCHQIQSIKTQEWCANLQEGPSILQRASGRLKVEWLEVSQFGATNVVCADWVSSPVPSHLWRLYRILMAGQ